MYANTGYLYGTDIDREDKSRPLIVACCGHYRLRTVPFLNTVRPQGRKDYQLMYVAAGNVYYFEGEEERTAPAGSLLLFLPGLPQSYTYRREEQTEVYWVHFTGSEAGALAEEGGGNESVQVRAAGLSPEFPYLYLQMIHELQLKRPYFEEMLALHLRELLVLAKRCCREAGRASRRGKREAEAAIRYFNENYSGTVSIEGYARSQNVSTCWFIRIFREYTGQTPMQYLTKIRIAKAASLLESTDYNVGEIGAVAGYENPLYFSRIFKKQTGYSPVQYRKKRNQGEESVSASSNGRGIP